MRDWEARCAPLLTARRRARRRGQGGTQWHADATSLRVDGRWCSLYRAIDREGNLVDVPLGKRRDMAAAQRFFAQALDIAGRAPAQVTTEGHDADPRAIRETPGDGAAHRTSRDKDTHIAQDHGGLKQRYDPLRGFGSFASAARCCAGFEEQRRYFRSVSQGGERVPLAQRRCLFRARWSARMAELAAA